MCVFFLFFLAVIVIAFANVVNESGNVQKELEESNHKAVMAIITSREIIESMK